jgi:hypothetical protein
VELLGDDSWTQGHGVEPADVPRADLADQWLNGNARQAILSSPWPSFHGLWLFFGGGKMGAGANSVAGKLAFESNSSGVQRACLSRVREPRLFLQHPASFCATS